MEIQRAADREPVVNHVHRELRRAILRGTFPPHTRLIETSLAEMLNVSRTPVREAISKLESEGLVRRLKSGGCTVEDNATRLEEVVTIRQGLEGAAARLACHRATDEELANLAELSRTAAAVVGTAPIQRRSQLDWEFHHGLAAASHSSRLVKLIEEFYEYSYSEFSPSTDADTVAKLQQHHIAVADALVARDADLAERLIREHLDSVGTSAPLASE